MDRDAILLTPGPLTTTLRTKLAMLKDWGSWDADFNLEKTFGISIDKDELFPQKIFQDEELVRNGVVTDKGLRFLEEKLPFADLVGFKRDPRVTRVPDLFTVGLLVNYVKMKLASS